MEIVLANGNDAEINAKVLLEKVFSLEKERRYLFTKKLRIDSSGGNRAFPELTLDPKDVTHEDDALARVLHLQFKWHAAFHGEEAENAVDELKVIFPFIPLDDITSANGAYMNLLTCSLEYLALKKLVGGPRAKGLISKGENSGWVATQVIECEKAIAKALKKCGFSSFI